MQTDSSPRDHLGRWRVVITGMGVKTPAGSDLKTYYDTLLAAKSVAGPITRFDPVDLPVKFACEVRDFDPLDYVSIKTMRRMDRVAQLGFAAAMDAMVDAGSPSGEVDRCGVVFGTGTGGAQTLGEQAIICGQQGADRVSPLLVPMLMVNATNAYVAMSLGWTGPNYAVGSACASGTSAVGEAARLIRGGDCDMVLAGGAENGVNIFAMAGFARTGAMSCRNDDPSRASRPFDSERDGYVMGEGGAFLLLERLDLALARDARIYGEILGYAINADAYHLTAPRPDGVRAAECIRKAVGDAGLRPDEIGHVNAHGTSTSLNDAMESRALNLAFAAAPPPVTGSKGVFGHMMGAAGAAEAVIAVLSAAKGVVPPTANHERTDPALAVDVVSGTPREIGRKPVLSNSFGFGGHNACLVLAPFGDQVPL
jgi:3-oxoacyl-[acyl-carrier-protein] synthase II